MAKSFKQIMKGIRDYYSREYGIYGPELAEKMGISLKQLQNYTNKEDTPVPRRSTLVGIYAFLNEHEGSFFVDEIRGLSADETRTVHEDLSFDNEKAKKPCIYPPGMDKADIKTLEDIFWSGRELRYMFSLGAYKNARDAIKEVILSNDPVEYMQFVCSYEKKLSAINELLGVSNEFWTSDFIWDLSRIPGEKNILTSIPYKGFVKILNLYIRNSSDPLSPVTLPYLYELTSKTRDGTLSPKDEALLNEYLSKTNAAASMIRNLVAKGGSVFRITETGEEYLAWGYEYLS